MGEAPRNFARWNELPELVAAVRNGTLSGSEAAMAACALVDHRDSAVLTPLLDHAAASETDNVLFLYALGRRAALVGRRGEAQRWLARAQSRVTFAIEARVRARIAFELGCLFLEEGGTEAAESVAAWAEGFRSGQACDLDHLRALIAEHRGESAQALALYRRSIATARTALTPLSGVLARRNLAESLVQRGPAEAVSLYRQSLGMLEAFGLDEALAPSLRNGLGYALLCTGDLVEARRQLDWAERESRRHHNSLISAYALFNSSVLEELHDDLDRARKLITQARQLSEASGLAELKGWCWIRESWLLLKSGDRDGAQRCAARGWEASRPSQVEALTTLDALLSLVSGSFRSAARVFGELSEMYAGREDILTAFTLLLWQAVAYERSDAPKGASAAVRRACLLRRRTPIRLSPNWWAREVTEAAAKLGGDQNCAEGLHTTNCGILSSPTVRVNIYGAELYVGGTALPIEAWQKSAGARVLRRLFACLVDAYPGKVAREILLDELWPESDGDKAVRNLYGAAKDLRRVLALAPGVRLVAHGSLCGLELGANVEIANGENAKELRGSVQSSM